jgi:hypothetical protein
MDAIAHLSLQSRPCTRLHAATTATDRVFIVLCCSVALLQFHGHRDFITVSTIVVIVFSLVYFCVVFTSEVVGTLRRPTAKSDKKDGSAGKAGKKGSILVGNPMQAARTSGAKLFAAQTGSSAAESSNLSSDTLERMDSANVNPLFLAAKQGSNGDSNDRPNAVAENLLAVLQRPEMPDAAMWNVVRAKIMDVLHESKDVRLELQV